jgi:methionyl-tRNA synthetase
MNTIIQHMKGKKRIPNTFYITTAIPYVNAPPHIGHAMEFVQTDALARYHKLLGEEVSLITGADENSLKIVQVAVKENSTPMLVCDKNSQLFKDLANKIGFSYTAFIRSSNEKTHWPGVIAMWNMCKNSGDIYTKKYRGLYCTGCEAFYTEDELVDGLCIEHLRAPEVVEEENYFFRLSRYTNKIKKLIETNKLKIIPEERKREALEFVKQGLEDFSISRSDERANGWGIQVPGDNSQRMYVWFDALGVYLTGVGFGTDKKSFTKWWPANIHVIGKGVIRFHAVFWPAMLMSAGLPLPNEILTHGYVTIDGQKMSKSLGNVVDPMILINKYGKDAVRYYLLRGLPTFDDGNFSERELLEVLNKELVGNIGNFVYRTLTFIRKNFGGQISNTQLTDQDKKVLNSIYELVSGINEDLSAARLSSAATKISEIAANGNRYFQSMEPWKTIKINRSDAERVMCVCANISKSLGITFSPYMPDAAEQLFDSMNIHSPTFNDAKTLRHSFSINEPTLLFKKVEEPENKIPKHTKHGKEPRSRAVNP